MARTTRQPPKKGKLAQMPSDPGNVAVEEPPETPFEPEAAADHSRKPPPSPPAAPPAASEPPPKNRLTFFERVRKVAAEDWGTRVFLYLYCFEPMCNEKIAGEKKYLNRFDQPIFDEHAVMIDYGSGKYRLTLANRKPAGDRGDAIDTLDFEIYNPKYPPKIPRAVWKNDARNARWEALLPKEVPEPPASTAIDPLAAFDTFMNIQDRIQERTMPPVQPPAAAPPVAADPFDTAAKIMQMRANDPMIAALMQRLDASDKAAEAARLREFELQKELRQPTSNGHQKGWLDQLVELAAAAEKLDPVKKLLGGLFGGITNGAGSVGSEGVVRTARTTGLDVLRDFVTSPVAEKIGAGLGNLFSRMADAPPSPVTIPLTPVANGNGAPQPRPMPAAGETDQQHIIRIAQTITGPMLDEYFDEDEPGDLFAERICDLWPADFAFLKGLGAERIVNLYRGFPPAWARIGPKEAQFSQFIKQMCEYVPESDDEPGVPSDDGIVDLDNDKGEGATA